MPQAAVGFPLHGHLWVGQLGEPTPVFFGDSTGHHVFHDAGNDFNTEPVLLDAGGDAGEPLENNTFCPFDKAFRFLQAGAVEVWPQGFRVGGEPGGHGGYSSAGGVAAATAAMISALVLPLTSIPS